MSGRDDGLGRRGFLKVAAGGIATAGIVGAPAMAGAAERPPKPDSTLPSLEAGPPVALGGAPAARWQRRRVDHGEVATIEVSAPGVRDASMVTAAIYRRVGTFRRWLGAASGRIQGGQARLSFRTTGLGPVAGPGLVQLTFRVRIWGTEREERLQPARDLEVLCTLPRFGA